jgi:hypothetical protein
VSQVLQAGVDAPLHGPFLVCLPILGSVTRGCRCVPPLSVMCGLVRRNAASNGGRIRLRSWCCAEKRSASELPRDREDDLAEVVSRFETGVCSRGLGQWEHRQR